MNDSTANAPWKRDNPRPGSKKLSSTQKQRARARARRAGRAYPNLVDNMREAAKARKKPVKRVTKKRATKKRATKKHVARS